MSSDAFQALVAFIKADYQRQGFSEKPAPVVTIARDHGAGGEEVAARVADALGVKCFDKEILESVLKAATSDPGLLRAMDENMPQRAGMFLYATLMGLSDPLPEYMKHLTQAVNAVAQHGGVIVGRGAHLLLRGALRFRVRVIGSEEVCARRLAGDNPALVPEKLAEVQRVNAKRVEYIRETFKVSNNDPLTYDLTINTDRFPDLADVADLIVRAYKAHAK